MTFELEIKTKKEQYNSEKIMLICKNKKKTKQTIERVATVDEEPSL